MAMPSSEASITGSEATSRNAHAAPISANKANAAQKAETETGTRGFDPGYACTTRTARAVRAALSPSRSIVRLRGILTESGRSCGRLPSLSWLILARRGG